MNKINIEKIAIIGKPNVGKSTILNHLALQKISIVTPKPHTTQKIIPTYTNVNNICFNFLDTPGINEINKKYLRFFYQAINTADIICLVTEHIKWDYNDAFVYTLIKNYKKKKFLILNKIDKIKKKYFILKYLEKMMLKFQIFKKIIPISAKKKKDILILKTILQNECKKNNIIINNNIQYNNPMIFHLSEIIREKFILNLNQELPYSFKIKINKYEIIKNTQTYIIKASVITSNPRHKKIFIGKKGDKIKKCSIESRKDMQKFLKKPVHLFIKII
ncbi:GTPase Era [Buchnera aphidicola (Thelaxes californica)]|uniref:GTPase Era n=1 Tax=Buchnera aphidicola (Thelaxes californica) TaxID=1315998 RepID=A0A4D6YF87_9GAMM|nr:GTPase Era [Buchnera aphidicola]QCI26733.1 GTPase Era [Buchnera aphidicola (Thelaxes californica)]